MVNEEDYFDVSADSLEVDCKRIKLDSSRESLESGEHPQSASAIDSRANDELPERP